MIVSFYLQSINRTTNKCILSHEIKNAKHYPSIGENVVLKEFWPDSRYFKVMRNSRHRIYHIEHDYSGPRNTHYVSVFCKFRGFVGVEN